MGKRDSTCQLAPYLGLAFGSRRLCGSGSCCLSCVPCVCSFVAHRVLRDPLPLHAFTTPSSCQHVMLPPCALVHGSSVFVLQALVGRVCLLNLSHQTTTLPCRSGIPRWKPLHHLLMTQMSPWSGTAVGPSMADWQARISTGRTAFCNRFHSPSPAVGCLHRTLRQCLMACTDSGLLLRSCIAA